VPLLRKETESTPCPLWWTVSGQVTMSPTMRETAMAKDTRMVKRTPTKDGWTVILPDGTDGPTYTSRSDAYRVQVNVVLPCGKPVSGELVTMATTRYPKSGRLYATCACCHRSDKTVAYRHKATPKDSKPICDACWHDRTFTWPSEKVGWFCQHGTTRCPHGNHAPCVLCHREQEAK
jgi:hypothetical protein